MSTRASISYHHNEGTGVTIHIYDEVAIGVKQDIRLEIEFPQGVVNVPCPLDALVEELSQYKFAKEITFRTLNPVLLKGTA